MYLGILVCLILGVLATWLGGLQRFVGAPMIGLFLGIIVSNFLPGRFIQSSKSGAAFSSKYLLKLGIILAGGTLSFNAIIGAGLSALPLIIFNICLSFAGALFLGRLLGVSPKTGVLVGGGTAICGGTAIATLHPVVKSDEEEMAYAMTAIFLFDILAAIMWPYAARALSLTPEQYGMLGGLAISDTSSVTAAGETFNALMGSAAETLINGEVMTAGAIAIVVKLTRTVMLVFVVIAVMLATMIKGKKSGETPANDGSFLKRAVKSFPLFVLGFLAMALINTFANFGTVDLGFITLGKLLSKGYKYFITVALVGVGYKIKLGDLFKKGAKPIVLGGFTWALIAASTLTYVLVFM
ncbi:MAG: YeiH family protein [Oscillospiraceae bacterium]|jgi:uncharacterized integral membrane protein (TIGR00698 family)